MMIRPGPNFSMMEKQVDKSIENMREKIDSHQELISRVRSNIKSCRKFAKESGETLPSDHKILLEFIIDFYDVFVENGVNEANEQKRFLNHLESMRNGKW
ncbi:hypothetical protein COU57_03590 [Candidatus Pacearchaeota archaeon CG10_big_fil_rev_8_21_14_0_10_32_14]|nr:MAG: hypothetical protein COU57_03590 [Candidatus Pacearchaeota archaeon CG10_big_fil_rev_8_21_14_0_10_32_14]